MLVDDAGVVVLTSCALALGSSELGVPARLAQPGARGPAGSQRARAIGAASDASTAELRTPM